jgi:RimJ/RimL family protein N-acetyltransferase
MEDCVDIPDVLVTKRLILRRWRPEDEVTMDAINRDPEVTRLLNRPLDEASLGAFDGLIQEHWATHGYGPWAVQLRGTSAAPMMASQVWPSHHRSWPQPGLDQSWAGA